VGERYVVRRHTAQTVLNEEYKASARLLPLESLQLPEGSRDQSSSACRGLPSKGEARALHHQPRPNLDLDHALLLLCLVTSFPTGGSLETTVRNKINLI
jgi:hypothetical protein